MCLFAGSKHLNYKCRMSLSTFGALQSYQVCRIEFTCLYKNLNIPVKIFMHFSHMIIPYLALIPTNIVVFALNIQSDMNNISPQMSKKTGDNCQKWNIINVIKKI